MKLVWRQLPTNLRRLDEELRQAIPELAPVFNPDLFDPATMSQTGAYQSRFTLGKNGDYLEISVPDGVDEEDIDSVLAAHDPSPDLPPVVYQRAQTAFRTLRTTNATATEIFRYPFPMNSGASFTFTFIATDAGNGAVKKLKVDLTGKRLASGIVQVGATTVLVNHADTAAASWSVAPALDEGDFLVRVTGAAGRTIDWGLEAVVYAFAPGGFADSV